MLRPVKDSHLLRPSNCSLITKIWRSPWTNKDKPSGSSEENVKTEAMWDQNSAAPPRCIDRSSYNRQQIQCVNNRSWTQPIAQEQKQDDHSAAMEMQL